MRSQYKPTEVRQAIQYLLLPYLDKLPNGYTYSWTGQQQEEDESSSFLTRAFIIALFLIAFILITQFNSIYKPFIVLSSVIMSISGVLYSLVIFNMPFVIIMTGIGIISLAGVVVNNAIVLIDYINILITRDGFPLKKALIEAGKSTLASSAIDCY